MAQILFYKTNVIFEIIGYLGSFLVLFSFLLKDVKWIRIINVFGAVFFIIYGIYTKTWVTLFMNVALIIVHTVYLVKMSLDNKKSEFNESLLKE